MIRHAILTFGVFFVLQSPFSQAQSVPDVQLIRDFAAFQRIDNTSPDERFKLADQLLRTADSIVLRVIIARKALELGVAETALSYLQPAIDSVEATDPQAVAVYDLADLIYQTLGDEEEALESALAAYNAAEIRLGPENPMLLWRLNALESRITKLRPSFSSAIAKMRATIEAAQSHEPKVRTIGDPEAVTVWFGTDRKTTGSADPYVAFGSKRGDLTVGKLTVTIPPRHLTGRIERPSAWSFTVFDDPKKHVVLASIEALARDAFAKGCCGPNDKLLFVHGYNTTFHDGALRAAQLAFDLEFRGSPLYYSWPSQASTLGYLTDANNVVASRTAIIEFLELVTRGEGKLHLIAHSLGNRYMLEALDIFLREFPDRKLGQVILAAPDVDRSELAVRFPTIRKQAESVTLYASANDFALRVSKQVNGAPRAGDTSGEPVRMTGLDTIDASSIKAGTLGHSYFGDAPLILGDILGLVRLGHSANQRCGIKPRDIAGTGALWDVKLDGCRVETLRAAVDIIRIHGAEALDEAKRLFDKAGGDELDFWKGVLDVTRAQLAIKE